jgi:hypothetical protein
MCGVSVVGGWWLVGFSFFGIGGFGAKKYSKIQTLFSV